MSQKNSTPSSVPTWSDILKTIQSKTQNDFKSKVRPAINIGRATLGIFLIALGQKLQPKR